MFVRRFSPFFIAALATCFVVAPGRCQELADTAAYVPESSLAAVRVKLQPLIESPPFQMMPIEIAQAWCQESLGLDLTSLEEIKVVVGMPAGPGEPPVGGVITTSRDYDTGRINPELLAEANPRQIGDREVYVLGNQSETVYLHAVNARTFLIATPAMLEPMVEAAEGKGPLASLMRANPIGEAHVQLIASIEPARPIFMQAAQQLQQQVPPPMRDLSKVPELLDALVVKVQFNPRGTNVSIEMLTADETQASQLFAIFKQSIDFGRRMVVSQMEKEVQGDGPLAEAQRAYAQRFSRRIAEIVTPKQNGNRLVVEGDAGVSVASTGVLVALLLPAVQAAREAARRTQAVNNLKQIGLALHNYHDTHKHFPAAAIVDDDGQPLLSWRVAILPYLEQQALYDRFHLDERWDSPHNIKLAEMVVPVYTDPSALTPPGHTVFHAAIGEDLAFGRAEGTRIRDFTDGTSNTILVVETDASVAVPWTAPDEIEIDLDAPLADMGHNHAGGFQVLFADGSVRFLAHSIDPDLFRRLLTRNGGEAVEF